MLNIRGMKSPPRVFLLSPAHAGGERAALLLRPEASFELAVELRSRHGASLGDVFTFASGLYFRGKRAYAQAFGRPPKGTPPGLVITSGAGLVNPNVRITPGELQAMASVPIDLCEPRYREPLLEDAHALAKRLGPEGEVVLLGSVATGKYTALLLEAFGDRLLFPAEFVGRGDMSRGGLLLRAVRANAELEYTQVRGAVVHGRRPPRLEGRGRHRADDGRKASRPRLRR